MEKGKLVRISEVEHNFLLGIQNDIKGYYETSDVQVDMNTAVAFLTHCQGLRVAVKQPGSDAAFYLYVRISERDGSIVLDQKADLEEASVPPYYYRDETEE